MRSAFLPPEALCVGMVLRSLETNETPNRLEVTDTAKPLKISL